ncbi:MAG: hypothetical protein E7330_00365 [Clostridiales bacterium]|nr:hypothetical protein [Clostridiales bacterium]
MVYRIDSFDESSCNDDASRVVLMLTDSRDYKMFVGSRNNCTYSVKISRTEYPEWKTAVGDFISFHEAHECDTLLVMSEEDLAAARLDYAGHSCNDPFLRKGEPHILIHSTPFSCYEKIMQDQMLKSWNRLQAEGALNETDPIGAKLGDPVDFRNYIMFGDGVTGEIVVNSKQCGRIVMDVNAPYKTGARLYFDAKKMAADGLLLRDGCHIKVKDTLSLSPYLIFAATWQSLGLDSQISTPAEYAILADTAFSHRFGIPL